jgi:hypothetical protein
MDLVVPGESRVKDDPQVLQSTIIVWRELLVPNEEVGWGNAVRGSSAVRLYEEEGLSLGWGGAEPPLLEPGSDAVDGQLEPD